MKNSRHIRVDQTFEELLKKVKLKTDMPLIRQTRRLGENLTPSDLIKIIYNKKQHIRRKREFNPFG